MPAYDIVLHGATGFTGQLTARYLASHPEQAHFSWAIAGRNPDKLARLQAALSAQGATPDVIVVQAADPASVDAMAADARVVLNLAGPFSEYHGDHVVDACARHGAHYADLSGEYWFQRRMIDDHHEGALRTGARLVFAAGVDSIPSDLGTQFVIEQLAAKGGRAAHVKTLFTDYAGSFSGGTSQTMEAAKRIRTSDAFTRDFHRDPYVLAPGAVPSSAEETVAGWDAYRFDRDFHRWGGPFFMAPINARIVRRSLALLEQLPCSYEEGISAGAWLRTGLVYLSRGFGYFVGDPVTFQPKPGQGPPPWLQRAGKFRALTHATTEDRALSAMVEVRGAGDPGYLATSKMLAEVGLCLLLDGETLPDRAGALTPATALGEALRHRLANAEDGRFMQFRVLS